MGLESDFERAREREDAHGYSNLSYRDQVLIAIWCLEAEVNNGGFHQFYFNSAGDYAQVVSSMLRTIEAHTMASTVDGANALFPAPGPPSDRYERQAVLEALTDAGVSFDECDNKFLAYPEDLTDLLTRYLSVKPVA